MMGSLARDDDYGYSDLGIPVGASRIEAPPQQPDPRFAMGALANQVYYEPQGTQWPNPNPPAPKAVEEDRPNPLIPFSAYRSKPPKHTVGEIAAENLIENGPFGMGMGLATSTFMKGFAPSVRGTAGGVVASAEPSEAEAARWIKYPFNSIAVGDTIENLMKLNRSVPTKQIIEKSLQPHDIPLGSWLTPLVGDRSRSGELLTHIGGKELREAVPMQGGYQFPPEWQDLGLGWASDKSAASTIAGRARDLGADSPGVYGVYTAMGPGAIDGSHHIADAVSQVMHVDKRKISKTATEKFDEHMEKLDPEFPGIKSKDLQQYMRDNSIGARGAFIKELNKKSLRDEGFPDIEQIRIAATHPNLIDVQNYSGGQSVAKLTGEVKHGVRGQGDAPHLTYGSKLPGEYMGGLAAPVPQDILWRDFSRLVGARNPSAVGKIWLTGLKGDGGEQLMKQYVDKHWQDSTAEYLRKNPMGAILRP